MCSNDRAAQPCVLLVDDDPKALDRLAKALTDSGICVVGTCERGEHAVAGIINAILQYRALDVIVVDAFMPGMDGLSVTRQVKALFPDLEVIVQTGPPLGATSIEALGAFTEVLRGDPADWLAGVIRQATKVRRERLADAHPCPR